MSGSDRRRTRSDRRRGRVVGPFAFKPPSAFHCCVILATSGWPLSLNTRSIVTVVGVRKAVVVCALWSAIPWANAGGTIGTTALGVTFIVPELTTVASAFRRRDRAFVTDRVALRGAGATPTPPRPRRRSTPAVGEAHRNRIDKLPCTQSKRCRSRRRTTVGSRVWRATLIVPLLMREADPAVAVESAGRRQPPERKRWPYPPLSRWCPCQSRGGPSQRRSPKR